MQAKFAETEKTEKTNFNSMISKLNMTFTNISYKFFFFKA